MTQPSFTRISELPEQLAIFPLPGALLFPRWQLPLNIFEPRYLNMIDDVIQGDRMIGMVQTIGGTRAKPDIAQTGCAGRITAWSETGDGRYLITLSGIARFDVSKELSVMTPYRQVTPDWTPYAEDLNDVPLETLVNALCSGCPFSVMEKQALVEAPTLKDRAETLITLLEMDVSGQDGGTLQ